MKTTRRKGKRKRKRLNAINLICWLILPTLLIIMLIMDGIGLYTFNKERIIIIGLSILVMLIPFFSEIRIKDFFIKKENLSNDEAKNSNEKELLNTVISIKHE